MRMSAACCSCIDHGDCSSCSYCMDGCPAEWDDECCLSEVRVEDVVVRSGVL